MIGKTKEGWWIGWEDFHHFQVEAKGRLDWDQEMLQAIKEYIPTGGCVLDIGANIGSHTTFYLDCVGPEGTVIAIEPVEEAFECLIRNCPQAHCYNFALGEEYGFCTMTPENETSCLSYVSSTETGYTRMVKLDTFWDTIRKPLDFIKLDAEGYELFILKGARAVIDKYRPAMIVEINGYALTRMNSSELDIRDFFRSINYTTDIFPYGWADIICLPA